MLGNVMVEVLVEVVVLVVCIEVVLRMIEVDVGRGGVGPAMVVVFLSVEVEVKVKAVPSIIVVTVCVTGRVIVVVAVDGTWFKAVFVKKQAEEACQNTTPCAIIEPSYSNLRAVPLDAPSDHGYLAPPAVDKSLAGRLRMLWSRLSCEILASAVFLVAT